jgi:uncharacterized protein with HEPN domain
LPSKHPRLRLLDIIQNIDAIQTYTRGMNGEVFAATNLVIDAVERCLGRISEAAKRLGKSAEIWHRASPGRRSEVLATSCDMNTRQFVTTLPGRL